MTDKTREQFEHWAKSEGYPVRRELHDTDVYEDPRTHAAYWAWQASRTAALEEAATLAEEQSKFAAYAAGASVQDRIASAIRALGSVGGGKE